MLKNSFSWLKGYGDLQPEVYSWPPVFLFFGLIVLYLGMIINGTFYYGGITKEEADKTIIGIKSVTKKASKSKKSALKFLQDAGIIKKQK